MTSRIVLYFVLLSKVSQLYGQNQHVADSLVRVYKRIDKIDTAALNVIDNIAFNLNKPDEIIYYAHLLHNEAQALSSTRYIRASFNHLGNAYRLRGDYDLAFDNYFLLLELAKKDNITNEIALCYALIADTYSVIGDSKNARSFYKKALVELRNDGDQIQLGSALLNTGDEYLNANLPDSAYSFFSEASVIFNREKYLSGQAYSLGNLGLVYAKQGKYELAEATLAEAMDILVKLSDFYGLSAYLINMADVYMELDEPAIALEYANLAYDYAVENGLKEQIRDSSLKLSEIYEEINKTGKAFNFLKTYLQYRDSLKNESIIIKMAEIRREAELKEVRSQPKQVQSERKDRFTEMGEADPEYYALIIGVSDYQNNDISLTDLQYPVADAEKIKSTLLQNYVFDEEHTLLISNPSRSDIINAFEVLAVSMSERDNLLIFYAGHGVWDDKLKIGYWLPSDANSKSKVNWISNSTVRDYISGLPAKHTLLISDACFSGSIFSTREVLANTSGLDDYGFSRVYKLSSRNAMTSGTLESVPDQSEFTKYLIKRLEENEKEYFTARQLFHDVETAVINNTNNIPQYGVIQNSGDEGGSFIFIKNH